MQKRKKQTDHFFAIIEFDFFRVQLKFAFKIRLFVLQLNRHKQSECTSAEKNWLNLSTRVLRLSSTSTESLEYE